MAQRPAKRHVLADIRIKCGLSQPGLAKILGVAHVTVQRIEQGRLALSEDLARRAEEELGVSASYLLANDLQEEPVMPEGWMLDDQHATSLLKAHGEPSQKKCRQGKSVTMSGRLTRFPEPPIATLLIAQRTTVRKSRQCCRQPKDCRDRESCFID